MSPFELGESRTKGALPHLVVYLNNGSDNDKRLAASAIIKLIHVGVNCYSSLPFLIKNLKNEKPQVRQYTLKALREFIIPTQYHQDIIKIYTDDTKDYNRNLAHDIIQSFSNSDFQPSQIPTENAYSVGIYDTESTGNTTLSEKGYVYFLKEDYAGRIKIGKTKDINQRLDTFNVKLPFNVQLLHVIESNNYHYTEKLFHILFQAKHINGEWFELNDNDIHWIKGGRYTKRIMSSIQKQTIKSKSTHQKSVSATEKQLAFLTALLENSQLMLMKPVNQLNVTDVASLIGYLYKGEPLPQHLKNIIQSKSFYNFN